MSARGLCHLCVGKNEFMEIQQIIIPVRIWKTKGPWDYKLPCPIGFCPGHSFSGFDPVCGIARVGSSSKAFKAVLRVFQGLIKALLRPSEGFNEALVRTY